MVVSSALGVCWNVDALADIAEEVNDAREIVVFQHQGQLALDYGAIDRSHAMSPAIDLREPLLMLEVDPSWQAPSGLRVADGRHRLFRAMKLGIRTLPALVVPKERIAECEIPLEVALERGWPRADERKWGDPVHVVAQRLLDQLTALDPEGVARALGRKP